MNCISFSFLNRKIVAGEQASSYTYDSSRPSQNCAEERKMQRLREQERRHREAVSYLFS